MGGALFTALILQDGFDSDGGFLYGGIWDLVSDGNCGVIQGGSAALAAYYLGGAGRLMPGQRANFSVNTLGGNTKTVGTVNNGKYAAQVINYDSSALATLNLALANGSARTASLWLQNSSSPTGAASTLTRPLSR